MGKGYWVGFFFFVALVVLLFGSLAVTEVRFTKPVRVKFHFDRVEGLRAGDDIRADGLLVGKVSSLELDQDHGGVKVKGHLTHPVELYEGYVARVESFTLLGGNYISLSRGKIGARRIDLSETLVGTAKPSALETAADVFTENREGFHSMIKALSETSEEIKAMVSDIRAGKGSIGKLATDTALYDEATAAVKSSRDAIQDIRDTVRKITETVEKINSGQGTAARLINDPSLYDEAKGLVTDLRADFKSVTADLREAVRSAREAADKITSGQGTVARLLNDPKMAENLDTSIENIRAASQSIREISEKAAKGEGTIGRLLMQDDVYDSAKKTLADLDRTLGRAARARVLIGGEFRPYGESELSINKAYLRIWPDDTKYFHLGVGFLALDSGGDLPFKEQVEKGQDQTIIAADLQAMYKLPWFLDNKLGLRVGMFEGQAGLALDYDFDLGDWPLLLSYEVRDAYGSVEEEDFDEELRGPMQRVWVRFPLWGRGATVWWQNVLHAVKVTAGASRLGNDEEFFVGAGLEYEDQDIRTLVALLGLSR